MSEATKQVPVRMPLSLYEAIAEKAARESRPVAAQIRVAIKRHIEDGS